MSRDTKMNELGTFLKARRSELTPRDVGLPDTGSRRVVGLRREEVAQLASISTDYYTRIEQGRIRVSAPVLTTLAGVLQLDEDQRTFPIGGWSSGPSRGSASIVAASGITRPDHHEAMVHVAMIVTIRPSEQLLRPAVMACLARGRVGAEGVRRVESGSRP